MGGFVFGSFNLFFKDVGVNAKPELLSVPSVNVKNLQGKTINTSTFKNDEGELFSGFIKGVTKYGKLQVLLEDEIVKKFDLKEIELLY